MLDVKEEANFQAITDSFGDTWWALKLFSAEGSHMYSSKNGTFPERGTEPQGWLSAHTIAIHP